MKQLLVLSTLFLLSCGKKQYTQLIDNTGNNARLTQVEANNLINQAKLDLHELRLGEISQTINDLKTEQVELGKYINFINNEYNNMNKILENIELKINDNENNLQVIRVCDTNEYILRINELFYSVHMVSNNYGTYLGMLSMNITYRTTDTKKRDFSLSKQGIICNY